MARNTSMIEGNEVLIKPAVSNSDDERGECVSSDDEAGGRKRKAKANGTNSKVKKVRVMEDSGQTDCERRQLRQEQRDLQKSLGGSADEIKDINSAAFENFREENNTLWQNVHFVREAVLDIEIIESISAKMIHQVDALIQVPRYDAARLAHKLRSKCSLVGSSASTVFDWKNFGIECGSCFNSVPHKVHFLAGPIHAAFVPKEKRMIVRKPEVVDEAEEETAEDVKQAKGSNKDANTLSASQKQIKVLAKLLHTRCEEEKESSLAKLEAVGNELPTEEAKLVARNLVEECGDRVCAVKFLFNPKSFTQTVENIFSLSFLVNYDKVEAGVRDQKECDNLNWNKDKTVVPGPWIRSINFSDEDEKFTYVRDANIEARQAIVRLNMKDWIRMCAAFEVEACDIPDRPLPKSAK